MMSINLFELLASLFLITLIVSISGKTTTSLLQTVGHIQDELSLPDDSRPSQLRCRRTPFLSDIILNCTNSNEQVTSYLISQ